MGERECKKCRNNDTIAIANIILEAGNVNAMSGYTIRNFEKFHSNSPATFGFNVTFERNPVGYIINYHLICGMLVLVASINFVIDPKIVPGRAGLLITIFLVLTSFFSDAQVTNFHY